MIGIILYLLDGAVALAAINAYGIFAIISFIFHLWVCYRIYKTINANSMLIEMELFPPEMQRGMPSATMSPSMPPPPYSPAEAQDEDK